MTYQPIENYGVVGDMQTVALVGVNGSIDWFCFPCFDSPSVFAGLLDDAKGGFFRIYPLVDRANHKQFYWPDTNVLMTRFLCPEGVVEVTDYMPIGGVDRNAGPPQLIRRVAAATGSMRVRVECFPAFNYARTAHAAEIRPGGAVFRTDDLTLGLSSNVPLTLEQPGSPWRRQESVETPGPGVVAEFTLHEHEKASFVLQQIGSGGEEDNVRLSEEHSEEVFRRTVEYWRTWLSQCTYRGRWREMVQRSALVLKLLTFRKTGAIVAAPTCGLPEHIGGTRNWDYRYTWIRDAAFTLYALLRIGFKEEAGAFMNWIEKRTHEMGRDGSLQVVYGLHGEHDLEETVLEHLSGYRGSRPVRIGNEACRQLQLDIYGELMDAVYLYNKHALPISYDLWAAARRLANWVCENWRRKDEGIWEVRGGAQDFTYSKVLCWVALDRALRLAEKRSFPADRDKWLSARDAIFEQVMDKSWNPGRNTFTQHYGSGTLDASVLIMPMVFFLSASDRRMLSTVDAILKSPADGGLVTDSLTYRYNTQTSADGLPGKEGTFNLCTFWLVEAMTRAGDPERLARARLIFEKMLGYANHLGLFSEETSAGGEALGNFPLALTHLSLISAAYNLDKRLG